MQSPGKPAHEQARLAALEKTGLLDTPPEERFDRYTRMATRIFGVPIALITLVDTDRQWFKSCHGLSVSETPRALSFCGHAILQSDLFMINDARQDERFHDNPLVTGEPFVRFYAGAPLYSSDGHRLGTLCLIDSEPGSLDLTQQSILLDLATGVSQELQLKRHHEAFNDLARQERRAQAIIEGTQVGTWEWDVQTGETVFNERWASICGYTLDELAPISIQTWLDMAHPEDLVESEQRLQAHFSGQASEYDVRCRMRHKDGHWVWVHDRGKVLEWTAQGEPQKMYGTHADITAEMENVRRMEQQNQALAALNTLALDRTSTADEKIHKALKLGSDFLGLAMAMLSEIVGDSYTVRDVHAAPGSTIAPGQTFPLGQTFCEVLLQDLAHLAIPHVGQSHYRDHPCYQTFGLEAYIAAPVRTRSHVYGTLNFSSLAPRTAAFSDTKITFVTLLADWVSGVLEEQLTSQTLNKLVRQIPGTLYQYRRWPDGTSAFPYASPGIRDIYGIEPGDVTANAAAAFDAIHPDDLHPVSDSIEASATNLSIWLHQYRVRSESGWRWVEGRASPEQLADGSVMWHGYIADVDDRKRAQLRIQESEEQLRRLFELSPIGIALTDYHSGEILDVNNALLHSTGYDRSRFLALSAEGLVLEQYTRLRGVSLQELRTSGRFGPYEYDITRADGSRFPAIIQGILIASSFGRSLIWTLVEDISERKKADRMKSEFISTVSHELRTPLTSISGSLTLIASGVLGKLPDKVSQMVAVAARNSDQLRHLIDDLLDMEKLVSGQMVFTPRPHRVDTLARDTLEQLNTFAVDKNVRFALAASAPGISVTVDEQRFRQALTNLLSNAIKYSPVGGLVQINIGKSSDTITVEVVDEGPGVPEAFHPRIFQKFAQADSSMTRHQGGTGLGLAITREIMTQMGGRVDFESPPGRGARFWLELPADQTSH